MKDFKILVVEDDKSIQNLITTTLRIHEYSYLTSQSGKDAVSLCASHKPDLILLDLGLPDIDGSEVIRIIRTWSNTPIIVISARDEDNDKITALDAGADDYLTKPFSVEEMLARIRVAQRRAAHFQNAEAENTMFENGGLQIDYTSGIVKMDGKDVHLTPIEYRILCLLARNAGKILTHSYIIDHIWGTAVDTDIVSLRVYMTALRKKLKTSDSAEALIQTHVGIGYQMIRL